MPLDEGVAANGLQQEYLVRRSDIYAPSHPAKPSYKGKFHEKIKQDREVKR